MIKRIETRSKECPDIKFALGGHSQGGVSNLAEPHVHVLEILTKFCSLGCRRCWRTHDSETIYSSYYCRNDVRFAALQRHPGPSW
jgi:hypothetical protein